VFKVASDLNYTVDKRMTARAYTYLETELAQKPPTNEGWWPSYTAWQAFAVKVLVEGGGSEDAHITRLYSYRDRMPIFALSYLNDALVAKGEGGGDRSADLRRHIGNAILPEAATAHVEELDDPYLLWFWNSNVRSTAIALNSLVKADVSGVNYRSLVSWLLQARKNGTWGNTQENALALEALVSYYPQVRGDGAELHGGCRARRDAARQRAVPGTIDRGEKRRPADAQAAGVRGGGLGAPADLHAQR